MRAKKSVEGFFLLFCSVLLQEAFIRLLFLPLFPYPRNGTSSRSSHSRRVIYNTILLLRDGNIAYYNMYHHCVLGYAHILYEYSVHTRAFSDEKRNGADGWMEDCNGRGLFRARLLYVTTKTLRPRYETHYNLVTFNNRTYEPP